jgi:perosamine synthetase
MLTLNDDLLFEKAKSLKSLAFGKTNKFLHQDIGFNYRLTNVQCAIGVAQMRKIDKILQRKREIAAFYLEALKDVPDVQLPVERPYAKSVYWMFNVVLIGRLAGKRQEFMEKMKERGIEVREDFVPYDEQVEVLMKKGLTRPEACPVADRLGRDGFYLPSGTLISQEELAYVAENFREVSRQMLG